MLRPKPAMHRIGKSACDQCSYCTEFCPRYLLGYDVQPHKVMRTLGFTASGRENWSKWADLCCACGLCTLYSCPEDLYPKEACDQAKADRKEGGLERWLGPAGEIKAHPMESGRHVPIKALMQSFGRTKTSDFASYTKVMELRTNSSNNTVYADADGSIAYFHANHIARRDPRFDWTRPVDGADPRTEWTGVLTVDESPGLLNPPNGWIQNTNNWPYTVSGSASPKRSAYPNYMERYTENPRGVHALRVLLRSESLADDSRHSLSHSDGGDGGEGGEDHKDDMIPRSGPLPLIDKPDRGYRPDGVRGCLGPGFGDHWPRPGHERPSPRVVLLRGEASGDQRSGAAHPLRYPAAGRQRPDARVGV